MKQIRIAVQNGLGKIMGMKLRYRLMLLYFAGGALPMIFISLYLINGTNHLLVKQAESAESTEIEMTRQRMEEMLATVATVSKYFIFDEALENIALKEYTNYQELVTDYRNYDAFVDYGSYYNTIISWISVYLENETIRGNSHFVKVDDEIRNQSWYQNIKEKNGVPYWQYLPVKTGEYEGLALTRLVKTKRGKNVGVLVLHVRPDRLKEIVRTREHDTWIILNGETLIEEQTSSISFEQLQSFLPDGDQESYQEKITVDKKEYVLTSSNVKISEAQGVLQIVSLRSYQDILREADKQNQKSILLFLFSVGLSSIMIAAFSWSFGTRVGRFHQQMQKAAAGEFDLVEKLGGNDEISELYDYMGTMILEIRRLLSEVYHERLQAERLRNEQRNAEYKVLASQINPHFLYNTLETIRMKARVNGQYDIERLVKMLAKILRKNIQAGQQDVTLQAETELISYYLEIQKYRFGERIQYHIRIDEDLKQYRVFPLLLQPIVENSIIHGLEIKEGIGHIDISIVHAEDKVRISIEDDGVGMGEDTLKELRKNLNQTSQTSEHIGVGNVHRRIRLRYGQEYGIEINSTKNVGTAVIIWLSEEGEQKKVRSTLEETQLLLGEEGESGNV